MLLALFIATLQSPSTAPSRRVSDAEQPEVVSSPNWIDYRNYPAKALQREEEGTVEYQLSIDESGRPRTCEIAASSGSESLDSGTCAMAMKMRFKPPVGQEGRRFQSNYSARVIWLLDTQRPIGATWLDADLRFDNGEVADCVTRGNGPYFEIWRVHACSFAKGLSDKPLFGSRMPANFRLSMRVQFRKTTQNAPWPPGAVVARDSTRFSINNKGDPTRCTPEEDGEIFSNSPQSRNPCGRFLASLWLETPPLKETPPEGYFELRLIAPQ